MLRRECYLVENIVPLRRQLVCSGLKTPEVPPTEVKVLGTIPFGGPVRPIFEDSKTQNPVPKNPQIPI
ncbi:MAG: hypothetical protein Q8P87_00410 [bacterium]|nr:hypothetical protein [bacterium]